MTLLFANFVVTRNEVCQQLAWGEPMG